MASIARQPFAPLDGARLQSLTSIKNRQNGISPNSSSKRKANLIEDPDLENVDPCAKSSKRSKSQNPTIFFPNKEVYKSAIVLTDRATPQSAPSLTSKPKTRAIASPRRSLLSAKSPARFSPLTNKPSTSSPLSHRAGRSSPRSKRVGLLSATASNSAICRRSSPFSRLNPASLLSSSAPITPFSLDAALKGTIPSYAARTSATPKPTEVGLDSTATASGLAGNSMKDSWFFAIHEDTPEQEMTNLLQHSTCVLDISSDEETETKLRRDHDEGKDKENVPPAGDMSQTSVSALAREARFSDVSQQQQQQSENEFPIAVGENVTPDLLKESMMIVDSRPALREMDASVYYSAGVDASSIFVVPGDDEDAETVVDGDLSEKETREFTFKPAENVPSIEPIINGQGEGAVLDENMNVVQEEENEKEFLMSLPSTEEIIMGRASVAVAVEVDAASVPLPLEEAVESHSELAEAQASVLEPVEETTQGTDFELWESGSTKEE